MLLKVIALKLSDDDRFAHLPFGMGTMVPFNMPSGVKTCLNIVVNKSDKCTDKRLTNYKNKLNALKSLQMHHPFYHVLAF